MKTDHLTADQRKLLDETIRNFGKTGRTAQDTLLAAHVTDEDRAAVAETLTAGAGSGYLR